MLSSTGYTRPRLADIKADLDTKFTDALGPVNTAPDSVVGQIIGIVSGALDDVYEDLQDTYDSMYPASAEDTSLDGAVSFIGLERIAASSTVVTACAYGTESTLVVSGSLARSGTVQYATTADSVISKANALDVEIEVTTVSNSTAYQIIAGGELYSFTSGVSATGAEIATGLAALLAVDFTASASGSKIKFRSVDGVSDFSVTHDTTLTITKLGSPVVFTAIEKGANVLPVGALVTIDSPANGWDSLYNFVAGATGRNVETDAELRVRHSNGGVNTGSATLKAIRARLLSDVAGVSSVFVYENREDYIVDTMPAHSIEVVVDGGDTQAVLNKVFEVKPAGIETHGLISGQVIDENGDAQTTYFTRPVSQYAWVRVSVNALYPEETLPSTTQSAISAAVLSTGNAITIGTDIITQRFIGPIYQATTGIGQITVEIAVTSTAGGTPAYSTNNIAISRGGVAVFDASRITVVGL